MRRDMTMERLVAATLALVALSLVRPSDVQAEELKGRVVSVSGGEARVAVQGELLPNEGDLVAFSYELPDMDVLARAGTGKVTGFAGTTVTVRIDAGDSGPQEGFLATIASESPRRKEIAPPADSLVGSWILQGREVKQVLVLRADKTGSGNGTEIRWESTATSLTLTMEGNRDECRYRFRGDVLILFKEGSSETTEFKRADDRTLREALREVNEYNATGQLKLIVVGEGLWRERDPDRNGCADYWTRDVAGFQYVQDSNGQPIHYGGVPQANSDRLGLPHYTKESPSPNFGYWLRAMKTDENGEPYIDKSLPRPRAKPVADRASTNRSKNAFCAYPVEYGATGVKTYIVSEEGVVFGKDLGPEVKEGCDTWPGADPTVEGWEMSE